MRTYLLFAVGCIVVLGSLFALSEAFQISWLTPESFRLPEGRSMGALALVLLLALDVYLPVPSALVLMSAGHSFGLWSGIALCCFGATLAGLVGWFTGRLSTSLLRSHVSPSEQQHFAALLDRFGLGLIVLTRPVPLIAEVVLIVAGAAGMKLRGVLVATLIGSLVPAIVFCWAGERVWDGRNLAMPAFLGTIGLLVALWAGGAYCKRRAKK